MLCCIAELACMIFGIIALVKGEFKLSANRVVRSGPARIIGALLLIPFVIGVGGEVLIGGAAGLNAAQQGKQFDAKDFQEKNVTTIVVIHVIGSAIPLLIALCIALATAGPPARRRRFDEDDDDDDRPRRRRRRDDDEDEDDDDRPRRRRTVDDEDDEEGRPRRRRRDDDDERIKER